MKKFLFSIGFLLTICGVVFYLCGQIQTIPRSETKIKLAARRSSVQVNHYIPVIKVSYTNPLPKDQPFDRAVLNEVMEAKLSELREALEKLIDEKVRSVEKYETSLTLIEMYGHEPKSRTEIPIGALKGVPEWARFPEKVLLVYKVEKKEVSPWEKENEKDISAISETTGVSISKAKEMLLKIKSEGYTVSKEAISEESEVKLLWFSSGWDASYPTTLAWKVYVEGEEINRITGYDPRGILKVKPIPEDKRVYVSAGYIDLKSQFKPESSEVRTLKNQIETLEKSQKDLEKEKSDLEEKLKGDEKAIKRDITHVTWNDVAYGYVKLEVSWWMSKSSGIFLGNSKVRDKMEGVCSTWGRNTYNVLGQDAGFVLTNAHVAQQGLFTEIYVSKDKEIMMIIGPGEPSIRYTPESDTYGSPAFTLAVDKSFVYSPDYDCAVLVTSKVIGFEDNRVFLGDSDKVDHGTRVITVGNPSGFQKFTSEGVVSNVSQPFLHGISGGWKGEALKHNPNLLRPSMWIDAPIGIGGTSGSGVWALEGSQKGKVISLRNAGLVVMAEISTWENSDYYPEAGKWLDGENIGSSGLVKNISPDQKKLLFQHCSYRDAEYNPISQSDDKPLKVAIDEIYYVHQRVAGMNMAVPINAIKMYLQERGIDPKEFGWEGLTKKYWEK